MKSLYLLWILAVFSCEKNTPLKEESDAKTIYIEIQKKMTIDDYFSKIDYEVFTIPDTLWVPFQNIMNLKIFMSWLIKIRLNHLLFLTKTKNLFE